MTTVSNERAGLPAEPPILHTGLLRDGCLAEYDNKLDQVWYQSARLNTNLLLLNQIVAFPFDVFPDTDGLCWTLLFNSLYECSVMAIWRVACDTSKDVLTIQNLKKWLERNARDESSRQRIRGVLKERGLELIQPEVIERVKSMRRTWFAHLKDREAAILKGRPDTTASRPELSDLMRFDEAIHADITVLSFDRVRARTYHEYDETISPSWKGSRLDIERLLELAARNSAVLRMPEEQPDFWPHYRERLTPRSASIFDEYRVKFGLSPKALVVEERA